MEIYQLKYVLAVAKHQNFTLAANEVCVTPSSLSQQIKKLEDELGVILFGRTTRSVHLTPAGIEFVENAKAAVSSIEKIHTSMQKYIAGENGHLTIGGIPALKAFGIIPVLASFQKTYPKISLTLHEAECFDLYPLICSGKIDVALLTAFNKFPPPKIPLASYPILDDELVMVTSLNHPFALKGEVDLSEAAQENFICLCKTAGLFVDTMDACKEAGFEPNFVYETSYVDTCLGLVAEGVGVALLTSRSVTNTLWKNIAIIKLKKCVPRTLYIVYPKKQQISPVLLNFKNYFVHWTQECKQNSEKERT
ncbi:MAG: LysR family transcriptional regulator [Peptococcaceae bacterium]|nr:LysR family transcriptional regulator [Peptococcaceae bacterium]